MLSSPLGVPVPPFSHHLPSSTNPHLPLEEEGSTVEQFINNELISERSKLPLARVASQ